MKVDIKHFQAFVIVAKHLHFTKAAEELHVSQPTLTLFIKQLEDAVGVELIKRSTRSVHLTDMGRNFLPTAENLVAEMAIAVSSLKDFATLQSGRLTIAVFPSVAATVLPPIVSAFHKQHQNIFIRIIDANQSALLDSVRSGEADFAIGHASESDKDLKFKSLFEDEIIAVLQKSHPFSGRKQIKWSDLENETVIAPRAQTSVRLLIDHTLIASGSKNLKTSITANSMHTISALVQENAGIGIIPSSYFHSISNPQLKSVSIHKPLIQRPIGIIERKRSVLTPAAKEFLKLAEDFI